MDIVHQTGVNLNIALLQINVDWSIVVFHWDGNVFNFYGILKWLHFYQQ